MRAPFQNLIIEFFHYNTTDKHAKIYKQRISHFKIYNKAFTHSKYFEK